MLLPLTQMVFLGLDLGPHIRLRSIIYTNHHLFSVAEAGTAILWRGNVDDSNREGNPRSQRTNEHCVNGLAYNNSNASRINDDVGRGMEFNLATITLNVSCAGSKFDHVALLFLKNLGTFCTSTVEPFKDRMLSERTEKCERIPSIMAERRRGRLDRVICRQWIRN